MPTDPKALTVLPQGSSIYPDLRPWDLEPHYTTHVGAMTTYGLHHKSDIALQLAFRDQRIERLDEECQQIDDAVEAAGGKRDGDHVAFIVGLHSENARLTERLTELEQRLARVAELAHDRDGDTLALRSERLGKCASVSWDHMEESFSSDPLKKRATTLPGRYM